jgi:hypothetical protein
MRNHKNGNNLATITAQEIIITDFKSSELRENFETIEFYMVK